MMRPNYSVIGMTAKKSEVGLRTANAAITSWAANFWMGLYMLTLTEGDHLNYP
jgi:hypothetical protein